MSPSSSRYKSRLFNFIFQQTRRVGEKCEQAVKQLQVASVWGTQVLLYPLYAIIQTTRLAGKQLKHASEDAGEPTSTSLQTSPADPPPTVDSPWQQVLAVAQTFELPETVSVNFLNPTGSLTLATTQTPVKNTTSFPQKTSTQLLIQGVASLISTQTIVLVATDNQVLDILTPSQQQILRRRIIQEVQKLDRHHRLTAAKSRLSTQTLPSNDNHPPQLPPLHWVSDWITWMQESPLAVTLNWFQETASTFHPSTLPPQTPKILVTPPTPPLVSPQAWSVINQTLTTVQALSLPSIAGVKTAITHRSQQLVTDVQKLSIALVSDPTPMAVPATETPTMSQDQLGIHALIHAAVEYFFKQRSKNLLESETPSPHFASKHLLETSESPISDNRLPFQKAPEALPSKTQNLADPWLSLKDLFGKSNKNLPETPLETPQPTLPASPKVTPSAGNFWPKSLNNKSTQSNIISNKAKKNNSSPPKPSKPASIPTKQSKKSLVAGEKPAATPNKPQRQQAGSVKHTPDWIETQATPLGYVKHPLERILQWLDRLMLWLEEVIIALWQHFQK